MSKDKMCDTCKKEKAVIIEHDIFYSCVKCMWKRVAQEQKKLAKPFEQARKWIQSSQKVSW
jgi:arsenate reductase-like glutaredoxin family protein